MTVSVVRAANNDRVVFVTEGDWVDTNEHVIVMACTDPRYQRARKEFIEQYFGLTQYDPIIVPGGPASMLVTSISCAVRRSEVKLLHKAHGFTRAIAFAHADCRFYREKYKEKTEAARRQHQFADLATFRRELAKLVPGIDAKTYYAEPASGKVQFLEVL